MINVQMSGLDEIIDRLQESPEVFRDARSRELEDIGQQLLPRVRAGIGGTGRIQNLQDVYMGSGKGYVAVRPKADVFLTTPGGKQYAAGAVTNAIEVGHATRTPSGRSARYRPRISVARVPGKYMYQDTDPDAERLAQDAGERVTREIVQRLEGE